ncbi:MAG: polysaccharide deacetylase family protein [Planctomycetota bacterium]|nr:polysaccharide deacetylase family protein [Planctomycetota bacterium]
MRIKRRLRSVIEVAALRAGILDRFERAAHDGLTVLTYHRVLPAAACAAYPFPSLAMPVDAFRAQMERVARHFEVVRLSEGVRRMSEQRHSARPLAAVTFDDGYDDNATIAAPILEALDLHATFFLVHDFVVHEHALWFDRAAVALNAIGEDLAAIEHLKSLEPSARDLFIDELEKRAGNRPIRANAPMSRRQARGLLRAGHEIGSHTLTHPILTRVSDVHLEAEVVRSKSALEAWLDHPIDGFCYPNGDHDERVRHVARSAGYRWACSTAPGRNQSPLDAFDVQRIDVTPSRVTDHNGEYSELAFRSEISLLRRALRGDLR